MNTDHRQDWDTYWSGAGGAGVFSQFAGGEAALRSFWSEALADLLGSDASLRFLDLACGSGAVTSLALQTADKPDVVRLFCVDYSVSAVKDLSMREPRVTGIAADACRTPFADQNFDIIVSQYGLEYAGEAAFGEAARLLAPGGTFTAICHLKEGAIHAECARNRDTIQAVLDCGFLAKGKSALNAAFALDHGIGTEKTAQDSAQAFNESIAAMKALIQAKGVKAAGGLPAQIFQDLGRMVSRRRNYAPEEIYHWIDAMAGELEAYAGRMRSMTDAAISEDEMAAISTAMTEAGLTFAEPEKLSLREGDAPAAWVVSARRENETAG